MLALNTTLGLKGRRCKGSRVPGTIGVYHLVENLKKSPKSTKKMRDFFFFNDYICDKGNRSLVIAN